MYYSGNGVPQDYIQAHMWLNLAASEGNETASQDREILAKSMTPDQLAEAHRLAREWKPTK
jgi:TPR repeat protein